MDRFNIGDKVKIKDDSFDSKYFGEEVGVIVGIDTREDIEEDTDGKYLVKFNSLDMYEGWGYGCFRENSRYIIEPYEGYATWLNELDIEPYEGSAEWINDLIKVEAKDELKEYEFKDEKVLNQNNFRDVCAVDFTGEEHIRTEFSKIREQKRQIVKEMSEKVLEMTLEIKEMEAEIERIKKEWFL